MSGGVWGAAIRAAAARQARRADRHRGGQEQGDTGVHHLARPLRVPRTHRLRHQDAGRLPDSEDDGDQLEQPFVCLCGAARAAGSGDAPTYDACWEWLSDCST